MSTTTFLETGLNRPYPPTIVYHGIDDSRVPYSSSKAFIKAIRDIEPVAAAVDALAQTAVPQKRRPSLNVTKIESHETSKLAFRCDVDPPPNHTARYVYLPIRGPGAGHGFDALLPRNLASSPTPRADEPGIIASRYLGGMVLVEKFVQHWLDEGSIPAASGQLSDSTSSSSADFLPSLSPKGSARVKVAKGGSRL